MIINLTTEGGLTLPNNKKQSAKEIKEAEKEKKKKKQAPTILTAFPTRGTQEWSRKAQLEAEERERERRKKSLLPTRTTTAAAAAGMTKTTTRTKIANMFGRKNKSAFHREDPFAHKHTRWHRPGPIMPPVKTKKKKNWKHLFLGTAVASASRFTSFRNGKGTATAPNGMPQQGPMYLGLGQQPKKKNRISKVLVTMTSFSSMRKAMIVWQGKRMWNKRQKSRAKQRVEISLANVARLRKLRVAEDEDVVNGKEYVRRLRGQYLKLNPRPQWVDDAAGLKRGRKRRKTSDGEEVTDSSDSDVQMDGDDTFSGHRPLADLLRDATSLTRTGPKLGKRKLRPEVIDIQRTKHIANNGPVSTLNQNVSLPILTTYLVRNNVPSNPSITPSPDRLWPILENGPLPLTRQCTNVHYASH